MKPRRLILASVAAVLVVLGLGGAAFAATATNGATGPNSNLGFLFAVYIITWAGFFGYIFIVSRRQRSLEREIDALRTLLEQQDSDRKG